MAYLASFRKKIALGGEQEEEEGSLDETERIVQKNHTFMNLLVCVKYRNGGKLSSHNWFFNGFCRELRPKYAVLLDVGLKPEASSLVRMYRYMRERP